MSDSTHINEVVHVCFGIDIDQYQMLVLEREKEVRGDGGPRGTGSYGQGVQGRL